MLFKMLVLVLLAAVVANLAKALFSHEFRTRPVGPDGTRAHLAHQPVAGIVWVADAGRAPASDRAARRRALTSL